MENNSKVTDLIPLRDQVIVRRLEPEEKTVLGIYVPDTAKKKSLLGEVVAVSKGRISREDCLIPMETKVGEIVSFPKGVGAEIKVNRIEYLIIPEKELLLHGEEVKNDSSP